ncbi:unnamed protein product [Cunninghamella blakesleeana]
MFTYIYVLQKQQQLSKIIEFQAFQRNINNGWCIDNMNHGHNSNQIANKINHNSDNNNSNNNNNNSNNENNSNNNNHPIEKRKQNEEISYNKSYIKSSIHQQQLSHPSPSNLPPSLSTIVNEYSSSHNNMNEKKQSTTHKKMSIDMLNSSNNQPKSKLNDRPTTPPTTTPPPPTSTTRTQAVFVNKLYNMLEDDSIRNLIHWSENGDLFCVVNPTTFSELVLPQYFKHNNWQSFVRQLNMYGFHKVNDMIHSNLTAESQKWEFKHQHFKRGAVDELQNIKRKSAKSHHQAMSSSTTAIPISSKVSSSIGSLNTTPSPSPLGKKQIMNITGNTEKMDYNINSINNNNNQNNNQNNQNQGHNQNTNNNSTNMNNSGSSKKPYNVVGEDNILSNRILQLEEKINNMSHTYSNLENDTTYLKSVVSQQETAIHHLYELLLRATSSEADQIHIGEMENIKSYIQNLQKLNRSSNQHKFKPDNQLSTSPNDRLNNTHSTTLDKSPKNKSTSAFIIEDHMYILSPHIKYEKRMSIEDHYHPYYQQRQQQQSSSNIPPPHIKYEKRMSIEYQNQHLQNTTDHHSSNTSSPKIKYEKRVSMDDHYFQHHNISERHLSNTPPPPIIYEKKKSVDHSHSSRMSILPIQSTDITNPHFSSPTRDLHQKSSISSPPSNVMNRSLPSINLVYDKPLPTILSPRSSSTSFNHSSSMPSPKDHDSINKPLTPIRSLLEKDFSLMTNNNNKDDLLSRNQDNVSANTLSSHTELNENDIILTGQSSFDSRPISPFMALGKESRLLNPDHSSSGKQPTSDTYNHTSEPKRRRTNI